VEVLKQSSNSASKGKDSFQQIPLKFRKIIKIDAYYLEVTYSLWKYRHHNYDFPFGSSIKMY